MVGLQYHRLAIFAILTLIDDDFCFRIKYLCHFRVFFSLKKIWILHDINFSGVNVMPIALLALTISAFAIGTTEFVIVGLLPTIAADLGVNLPSAGLLV